MTGRRIGPQEKKLPPPLLDPPPRDNSEGTIAHGLPLLHFPCSSSLCAQGREKGAPAIQQFPAIDGCSLLSAESTGAFSCPSAQSSYSPAFAARLGGPPGKDDVRAKERALSSSIFHFGSIRRLPARLFGGGGGAHHKAFPLRRHFSRPPSARPPPLSLSSSTQSHPPLLTQLRNWRGSDVSAHQKDAKQSFSGYITGLRQSR